MKIYYHDSGPGSFTYVIHDNGVEYRVKCLHNFSSFQIMILNKGKVKLPTSKKVDNHHLRNITSSLFNSETVAIKDFRK